jgi:acetyl-CoA acetyltransferase
VKDVVIVEAVRTPVGVHGGMLRGFDALALSQVVMRGVLERTKIDPAVISEVVFWRCFSVK